MTYACPSSIPYISAADLLSMIGRPNVVIIDNLSRGEEERSKDGHIAGSLHFASQSFVFKFQDLIEAVKSKDTVVFYCPFGLGPGQFNATYLKSYLAHFKAMDAPKNIVVLAEGYNVWKASGKPVCHCREIPCKGGAAKIAASL